MKRLLTIEISLLDNNQTSVKVDGTIDPLMSIGFLEKIKLELLQDFQRKSVPTTIAALPPVAPKRF